MTLQFGAVQTSVFFFFCFLAFASIADDEDAGDDDYIVQNLLIVAVKKVMSGRSPKIACPCF